MTDSGPDWKIKFHDESIRISSVDGREYYRAFIPPTIEHIDLEQGDYVDIRKEGGEDDTPVYLRAEKVPPAEVNRKIHYKISKHGSRRYLTIPEAWSADLINDADVDQLVVEINLVEEVNHLRIYRGEDFYRDRKPEIKDQGWDWEKGIPIILPVFEKANAQGATQDGVDIDIAGQTQYSGQRFRLIPYNVYHKTFTGDVKGAVGEAFTPSSALFEEKRKQGQLPTCTAPKLTIKWSFESTRDYSGEMTELKGINPHQQVVYTGESLTEVRANFPCKGEFEITTESTSGSKQTWLTYSPSGSNSHDRLIGDNWYSKFYHVKGAQKPPIVYLPCVPV